MTSTSSNRNCCFHFTPKSPSLIIWIIKEKQTRMSPVMDKMEAQSGSPSLPYLEYNRGDETSAAGIYSSACGQR